MNFDWINYLILAAELSKETSTTANQQAKFRSAVSRAYYAAFNQAKIFLEDRDKITIQKTNVHKAVINQFQNSPDLTRQKIGNRLQVLRSYRNQADYDAVIAVTAQTCQEAITLARRIILSLDI